LRTVEFVRPQALQKPTRLHQPSLQGRVHHRCRAGCRAVAAQEFDDVRLDLVAANTELLAERQHVRRQPRLQHRARIHPLRSLQRLRVVEEAIQHVQAVQHGGDNDVVNG
jgi:hypothetical protein